MRSHAHSIDSICWIVSTFCSDDDSRSARQLMCRHFISFFTLCVCLRIFVADKLCNCKNLCYRCRRRRWCHTIFFNTPTASYIPRLRENCCHFIQCRIFRFALNEVVQWYVINKINWIYLHTVWQTQRNEKSKRLRIHLRCSSQNRTCTAQNTRNSMLSEIQMKTRKCRHRLAVDLKWR